jgi:hypothetical protein
MVDHVTDPKLDMKSQVEIFALFTSRKQSFRSLFLFSLSLYLHSILERVKRVLQGRIFKDFLCWLSLYFQCEGEKKVSNALSCLL